MKKAKLKLVHSKLIQSFQLLELAKSKGRISEEKYSQKAQRYIEKIKKIEESAEISGSESYFSDLPLPGFIQKEALSEEEKEQSSTGVPYEIMGGLAIKMFVAFAAFMCLTYFLPHMFRLSGPFLIIAFGCPLLYLAIMYVLDKYEPEPIHFVAGAFLWGVVSTILALWLNMSIAGSFGLVVSICLAGVTEELVKGIAVYRIARHDEFNDAIDALVYGFAVGLGFAAMENVLYYSQFIDPARADQLTGTGLAFVVSMRASLCAMGHAVFTSIIALVLAKAKHRNGVLSFKDFLWGYFLAALVHGIFNYSCVVLNGFALITNGLIVLAALYIFWNIIKKTWAIERSWGWHLTVKK